MTNNPRDMSFEEFWDTFGDELHMPDGYEWRESPGGGEIHLYGTDGTDYSEPEDDKTSYISPRTMSKTHFKSD